MGAIELVSPVNKDRAEARLAFAAKCVSYLTRGIGLIAVDIVTNHLANLHNEVMRLFGRGEPYLLPTAVATYAVVYRPSRQPRSSGPRRHLLICPLSDDISGSICQIVIVKNQLRSLFLCLTSNAVCPVIKIRTPAANDNIMDS